MPPATQSSSMELDRPMAPPKCHRSSPCLPLPAGHGQRRCCALSTAGRGRCSRWRSRRAQALAHVPREHVQRHTSRLAIEHAALRESTRAVNHRRADMLRNSEPPSSFPEGREFIRDAKAYNKHETGWARGAPSVDHTTPPSARNASSVSDCWRGAPAGTRPFRGWLIPRVPHSGLVP